ncbi:hypothetical protein CK203_092219 [Vitis vinifera]|uniref:Uncharacterized protein n=1 Tax=Vitis vinifera TaxID=29760 RepID=A0A438F2G5_VITVI|nr:hypothetical protein CK203_092219 [Vitis vinifera]
MVRTEKADLVWFRETIVQEMSLKVVKSLGVGRFLSWGVVDARGVPGGILIFWDNKVLDLLELSVEGSPYLVVLGMLEMVLYGVFTRVYGPILLRKKKDFWEELKLSEVYGMILGA